MQYLATIYVRERGPTESDADELREMNEGYTRFGQLAASAIRGGEALQPVATGSTVREPRPGTEAPLVTDGPFTESTEVVGGYYVLETDTFDQVVDLVKEIPAASDPDGAVEVRPVVMVWAPELPVKTQPGDARYLATIYGKESAADVPDTPEWDEMAAVHGRFIDKHAAALLSGVALQPAATATTVRVRNGDVLVTDGPFAETEEVIGGLYLLRAATRSDAVAVAQDIPTNPGGAVELRPIMEFM